MTDKTLIRLEQLLEKRRSTNWRIFQALDLSGCLVEGPSFEISSVSSEAPPEMELLVELYNNAPELIRAIFRLQELDK